MLVRLEGRYQRFCISCRVLTGPSRILDWRHSTVIAYFFPPRAKAGRYTPIERRLEIEIVSFRGMQVILTLPTDVCRVPLAGAEGRKLWGQNCKLYYVITELQFT